MVRTSREWRGITIQRHHDKHMKPLFVIHPLFRLIGPVFTGLLAYVLIIMKHNAIDLLYESFLNQEVYLCVLLALMIQESTIAMMKWWSRSGRDWQAVSSALSLLVTQLFITISLVIVSVHLYYRWVLGYSPDTSECILFATIYGIFSILYIIIYYSYYLLEANHKSSMEQQLKIKEEAQSELLRYVDDINYDLLINGLESIIALSHKNIEEADECIVHLSQHYRYSLSKRDQELVRLPIEISSAQRFVSLISLLPYRDLELEVDVDQGYLIPGTIIYVLQHIVNTTIPQQDRSLNITIDGNEHCVMIKYIPDDKLNLSLHANSLQSLMDRYAIFTDTPISITNKTQQRIIRIPILVPPDGY